MLKSYLILAAIIAMTLAGDYALKMASGKASPFVSHWFVHGAILYGITAAGWIMLMQTHSLAQVAVLYSSATILALTAIGYVAFDETITGRQVAGVVASMLAVFLMDVEAG
ncbi:hypothetical protein RGUI_3485 [Rhodovulum sp. P5]|uniref:hypothetical protein n=1 Tax=Rhodovulum sp. P5 TaxID=1564506 RepID=UPI0009C1AF31|nr:hypothetical protein [Rhodovulum sp. P5]ARE41626.1 hypothetical protein RGUI_3485 [Rhodovulum sp. P5]